MPLVNKDAKFEFHKADDKVYAANSLSNKIILVESQILTDLEKKADELREKKVAEFYSWDADKIWVQKGELDLTAAKEKVKEEDKWFLSSPAKAEADGSKIETLIRKIEGMEAAEFVDLPKDQAEFGLDRPLAEAKIWTKEGENKTKETHILFGKIDSEKKQIIVKNAKYPYLFKVDSAVLDEFPKEARDWQSAPPKPESSPGDKK
jgi:hypothetical protein